MLNGTSVIGSMVGTRADLNEVFGLHDGRPDPGHLRDQVAGRRYDAISKVLHGKAKARLVLEPWPAPAGSVTKRNSASTHLLEAEFYAEHTAQLGFAAGIRFARARSTGGRRPVARHGRAPLTTSGADASQPGS